MTTMVFGLLGTFYVGQFKKPADSLIIVEPVTLNSINIPQSPSNLSGYKARKSSRSAGIPQGETPSILSEALPAASDLANSSISSRKTSSNFGSPSFHMNRSEDNVYSSGSANGGFGLLSLSSGSKSSNITSESYATSGSMLASNQVMAPFAAPKPYSNSNVVLVDPTTFRSTQLTAIPVGEGIQAMLFLALGYMAWIFRRRKI